MARRQGDIPTGRTRRAVGTAGALAPGTVKVAASLVASLARSPDRAAEVLERRHEELADAMLATLGSLRGGAMKVGQLASIVDVALLPERYRAIYQERLAGLRDAAPPMPWPKVAAVLEAEWGRPPDQVLDDLGHDAVAAASIGQVHRGRLPDGRPVAVKVQYPEIADALAADVDTVAVLAPLAKALMPGFEPRAVVGELRERILEELDYELEAQHQRAFGRAYRGHPFIAVPGVVTELCGRRVLVSDWVDGEGFDAMRALPQEGRDRLGEVLQRFFFGAMHRLGRFQTDAHPGNYLLQDDGRVAFLDFGSVKVVDPAWLEASRAMVLAAFDGDARTLADGLARLGYLHRPERVDAEALLAQARATTGWFLEDRALRIDPEYVAAMVARLTDPRAAEGSLRLLRDMKVPPEEIWIRRLDVGVVAVLGQLRACANWHRISREYLAGDPPSTELGRAEQAFFARR